MPYGLRFKDHEGKQCQIQEFSTNFDILGEQARLSLMVRHMTQLVEDEIEVPPFERPLVLEGDDNLVYLVCQEPEPT